MNGVVEGAFRRHYGHVFRYLRRRVGDPARAEELTQDVFVAAARGLPDESEGGPPVLAWLYTVAKRRFADEARRLSREARADPLLRAHEPFEYGPAVAAVLREALDRLPAGQRRVVVLKLLRGGSFAEIAAITGTSETAARMRFSRGLRALRADLTEEGLEP